MSAGPGDTFVTREQFSRVMQVFVPTLLFCVFMQWLGLYVASFILIAGFMWFVGRIALWKSLLTAFLFSVIMFVTFDIAFDVINAERPAGSGFRLLGDRDGSLRLLLHGFAVLMTWKTIAFMIVGLVLGIFRRRAARPRRPERRRDPAAAHPSPWTRPPPS